MGLWATVETYCLHQVQVSESPIVLQGFLASCFTYFYLCLSIVLKRVHLDPDSLRSLFACVGVHLCFCPCLCLMWLMWSSSMWSSSALPGQTLQSASLLERKLVAACFGHSQLPPSKFIHPAHWDSVRQYDILPTSTTCSACFVTGLSHGTLFERFEPRLGIVLGIVLRGVHLCKSHAGKTERIACRGLHQARQQNEILYGVAHSSLQCLRLGAWLPQSELHGAQFKQPT